MRLDPHTIRRPFYRNSTVVILIAADDFWDSWGVKHPADGGLMEFDEARTHPEDHVWTVVESGDDEDGNWYAAPGFHLVNRLGYVVTTRPWVDYTQDAIYFLDDMEDDEDRAN